jgi:hypothetical protein
MLDGAQDKLREILLSDEAHLPALLHEAVAGLEKH